MLNSLISIDNLNKSFGETHILKSINFSMLEGEFVAIQGPSGSGKSTLLSIIGLLDEFNSGEYNLCQENVSVLSEYQKSRLRNENIGWIFQNFNLIGDMTVFENVSLPLKYCKRNINSNIINELLDQVGLSNKSQAFPNQLSGGQQQRVAIARALALDPDLILADEPTGNLDTENGDNIVEMLVSLHKKGKSIVLITHDKNVAARADRVIHMSDGKLL